MAVTGLWAFFWFVSFCYTADQRRKSNLRLSSSVRNCMNSTIAFSFFSIFLWVRALILYKYNYIIISMIWVYEIFDIHVHVHVVIVPNANYMCRGISYIGDFTTRDTLNNDNWEQWYFIMLTDPSAKDTSIKRTSLLVPIMSVIDGFPHILVSFPIILTDIWDKKHLF